MEASSSKQRTERRVVQLLLRSGLAGATLSMAAGLALSMLRGHDVSHAVSLSELPTGLAHGQPSALMALGILILFITPLAGVISLVVGFALERDWRFAAVAFSVACILVLGIFLGHA